MFCPKCKREFIKNIKTCPTCGASLVKTLSQEDKQKDEPQYVKFVTVMETRDRALIAFIKSIFENAGIKYFINGEDMLNLGKVVSDVQIQVEESYVQDAMELLKEVNESKQS
jgi:hypothetical protein